MRANQKTKMRKSTRYMYYVISIILLIVSAFKLLSDIGNDNVINTRKEIYNYTNRFNYDYKVNLLNNNYITQDSLGMDYKAYVTELIDTIPINFNYEYEGNSKSEINYKYSIIGKLEAVYTKDGKEQKIWEKEEVLKKETEHSLNSNLISIKETLNLDLKDENKLVNSFEQEMGMSITAKYFVILQFNSDTVINGENVPNEQKQVIAIDLGSKTTTIDGQNDIENTEYITKEYQEKGSSKVISISLEVLGMLIAVILLKYLSKTQNATHIRNEYKQEINRILRLCQDKIVKLDTRPNDFEFEIVRVRDFGEIVKLSEELFKPILFWEDKENEEALFIVMSNQVVYQYKLKRGK